MVQILIKNDVSLKNSKQIEYIPLVVLHKCYVHILEVLQVLLGEGGDKIRQLQNQSPFLTVRILFYQT